MQLRSSFFLFNFNPPYVEKEQAITKIVYLNAKEFSASLWSLKSLPAPNDTAPFELRLTPNTMQCLLEWQQSRDKQCRGKSELRGLLRGIGASEWGLTSLTHFVRIAFWMMSTSEQEKIKCYQEPWYLHRPCFANLQLRTISSSNERIKAQFNQYQIQRPQLCHAFLPLLLFLLNSIFKMEGASIELPSYQPQTSTEYGKNIVHFTWALIGYNLHPHNYKENEITKLKALNYSNIAFIKRVGPMFNLGLHLSL